MESGKHYSQVVNTSYHLSMAALEPRHSGTSPNKHVKLMLEHAKAEFLLCTLHYEKVLQVPLDLNFVEGEEVTFFIQGEGTVHLTGYLTDMNKLQESDATSDEESSVEEVEDDNLTSRLLQVEDEDSEDSDFTPGKASKSKPVQNGPKKAKASKTEIASQEDGISDEADLAEDGTEDEDEEQSGEDEEQSGEEEQPGEESGEDEEQSGEEEEGEDDEEEVAATPVVTPGVLKRKYGQQEFSKRSTKKSSLSNTSVTADETSPEEKARKKRKRSKRDSNTTLQPEHSPMDKNQTVLQGGIQSQDLRIGSGPVAKPGKNVHVYYTGKLANNKEFDSCRSGKAFSFKMGKGDVIKGWDIGIQGMRVGGKRRLVVPPSQGYGNARAGAIPPNSTLYFDVELKAVS